jgi:predicted Zn-dependent protease
MSPDRSMNAGATADGHVILNRGLVELAANDDEIAITVAHELAHHIANHPANSVRNRKTGALLGGLVGFALDGAAIASGAPSAGIFTSIGMQVGAQTGRLSYSREQEREADYLGVVIAFRAGIDLDRARGNLLAIARLDGRRQSSMMDSHPVGAERVALYDRAVAEVRASNGALPPRAK